MGRVLTRADARSQRDRLYQAEIRLALTNGCFDILHVGHVRYLHAAAQLGDQLWIGLNTDQSVRLLKGPHRPLIPWRERAELLAALDVVDAVVAFDTVTAGPLLAELAPDVYVKGGDYTPDTLPEIPVVRALGIRLELIPPVPARSTSDLIQTILDRYGQSPTQAP